MFRKLLVPEPDCCCQVQLVVTAGNCHSQETTMIRKLLLLLLDPDQCHACNDHITKTDNLLWLLTPTKLMTNHWDSASTQSMITLTSRSPEAAEMWALPCFYLPNSEFIRLVDSKLLPEPSCESKGGLFLSVWSLHV